MSAPVLEIRRSGDGFVEGACAFPADWEVFEGHFPGRPIVPGAELIRLAAECLALDAGVGRLTRIDRCIFRSPLGPAAVADFTARRIDARVWSFRWTRGEVEIAAGRLRFAPPSGIQISDSGSGRSDRSP